MFFLGVAAYTPEVLARYGFLYLQFRSNVGYPANPIDLKFGSFGFRIHVFTDLTLVLDFDCSCIVRLGVRTRVKGPDIILLLPFTGVPSRRLAVVFTSFLPIHASLLRKP